MARARRPRQPADMMDPYERVMEARRTGREKARARRPADEKVLREVATKFRRAMEGLRGEEHWDDFKWLNGFPRSCCVITSRLLGRYLHEAGFLGVEGRSGENLSPWIVRDEIYHHTWIEVQGIIVDLTADQFKVIRRSGGGTSRPPGVIVTTNRIFHDEFLCSPKKELTECWCEPQRKEWAEAGWPQLYERVVAKLR
ncbi:hypothetical protein [Tautonia rosea]|uniref:hypothetical protein n=1 Tax=Tautonia rosea TaxID=2728037 RepID=UPI0014756BEB|nr:hypothetical protein [Tautonia rosea]